MSTRTTLCAKSVRAMLHCAAQNDVRWYLNGITIDPVDGKAVPFTSNGSILASLMTGAAFSGSAERIFLPRSAVARIPATASSVTVTQRADTIILRIDGDERTTRDLFKRPPRSDVNLVRLLPRRLPKNEAEPVPLHPANVVALMKTVIDLGRALGLGRGQVSVQLTACDQASASLVLSEQVPEFAGLIMPMRCNQAGLPAWIGDLAKKEAATAKKAKA